MIWCLFSVDNDYNQPSNNLVVWWYQKPTLDQLREVMNASGMVLDDTIYKHSVRFYNTDYRVEQVKPGVVI